MEQMVVALVDDDADDREFITMALKSMHAGVTVHSYPSGKRFLESLERAVPDLVITDLRMPLMNGFELIDRIKSEQNTRNIPVVVLSTSGDVSDRKKAAGLGACGYYIKPFSLEDYSEIAGEIVDGFTKGTLEFLAPGDIGAFVRRFLVTLFHKRAMRAAL